MSVIRFDFVDRASLTASASPPPQARTALPLPLEPLRGATLGRVEIVGKLGSGGMADVWLGRIRSHGGFERLVAVKTVHPHLCADARSRELFLREARLAAMIRHANVVDVQDVGEADGVLFQVMTLVEGEDLASILAGGAALPPGVVASIIGDALMGLHAAHEIVDEDGRPRQLVHRDVSPQNVLVGLDGVARVSDFGIAKALFIGDDTTGSLRGKVSYFSPEQASQAPLDRRSDVFSTGIVLWEALTRKRLFRKETLVETIARIQKEPIADPREVEPSVPAPLAGVAMRALARDPEARYPTAQAMAQDLTGAAREAGCLLPRPEVAATIDAMIGAKVRARRAALLSAAPAMPEPAVDAPIAAAAPASGARARRGPIVVVVAGAVLAILGISAVLVTRRGASGDDAVRASASTTAASASTTATPATTASTSPVEGEVLPPAPTSTTASKPPAKAPPRATPAPARHPPTPRKAPFDQNPFGPPSPP